MQTPPFRLVLSEIDHPGAIAALADDLVDRDLPGAIGPVDHVRAFVDAPGLAAARRPADASERIFRLTEVRPPRPAPGRLRVAEPADRDLLLDWIDAFMREALRADPRRESRR